MPLARSTSAELESFEEQGIDTCTTCPGLCRWACPVAEAEARETVSPHALVVLGGLLRRGIASVDTAGDHPYRCTQCGACTEACLHRNDVPLLLDLARARVIAGHGAPQVVSEVRGNFGVAGNPQGVALEGVLARVTSESDIDLARTGDTVYFPGCETLHRAPEAATAFLRTTLLFGVSGVSVTPLSALCCGLPLLWAGDLEAFAGHAARFAAQVRDIGTLVVHDPACAEALVRRYPAFGVRIVPRVQHVSTFIAGKLGAPRARGEGGPKRMAAYHDPCSLARGLGIVEEPRRLLERAADLAQMPGLRGRESDCCGANGLLPLTAPDTARAMAEARLLAFRASGAGELVTFSARCAAHLRAVDPQAPVVDVMEILSRL